MNRRAVAVVTVRAKVARRLLMSFPANLLVSASYPQYLFRLGPNGNFECRDVMTDQEWRGCGPGNLLYEATERFILVPQ